MVRGATGLAGLTLAGSFANKVWSANLLTNSLVTEPAMIDRVPLGKTGLKASRLAMGTGSIGTGGSSNQTRMGLETFVEMFRHGYDRGVRFTDMAEGYGSMPFVGAAIKGLPRENITLLSKMWTYPDGNPQQQNVRETIHEYLRQLGTEHIDILLLHCMTTIDWNQTRTHYMEAFLRAKEEGLVRAVGVSCHDHGALVTASTEPWVDVIMARINPFGARMDADPQSVCDVLKVARNNGKGLVGMKIFGEGTRVLDHEREQSIRFGFHEAGLDTMTIGFESIAQLDDAVEKVIRNVKS